jgi:hypothetical protein
MADEQGRLKSCWSLGISLTNPMTRLGLGLPHALQPGYGKENRKSEKETIETCVSREK